MSQNMPRAGVGSGGAGTMVGLPSSLGLVIHREALTLQSLLHLEECDPQDLWAGWGGGSATIEENWKVLKS